MLVGKIERAQIVASGRAARRRQREIDTELLPPRRSHSLRATPAPASGWIGSTSSCRRCFAASSVAAQHQTKRIFFISASVRLSLCPLQSA
jgi:hypothetical protein